MILLYHLIFPDDTPKDASNAGKIIRLSVFKKHINWLMSHYEIVSLADYLLAPEAKRRIVVTFDDGYRETFDLISPFLIENGVPATFFVTTSHLADGQLLWFVYFNALCFENAYQEIIIDGERYSLITEKQRYEAWRTLIRMARESGDAIRFSANFTLKYPLPDTVTRKYLGLTEDQIKQFGDVTPLNLGGHTHRHPYLDQISFQLQKDEMRKNKTILESLSGKPVKYFAYPGGVYNEDAVSAVRQVGFEAACAVQPRHLGEEDRFEMPRVDIYSASLMKLKLKVLGVGNILHRLRGRDDWSN